jgi:hypothetical protein
MEEYHKKEQNKGAKNKNISRKALFLALMLWICLVQAGCQQFQSNTPSTTPKPASAPAATPAYPKATPSASIVSPSPSVTPSLAPSVTPSVEPVLTPAETADKIIKTADELDKEKFLNIPFLDETPPRAIIIYTQLLSGGYKTQELTNQKFCGDVFLKMLSDFTDISEIGTPGHGTADAGIYCYSSSSFYSDIHVAYKILSQKSDQCMYQYFIEKGRFIKGYDRKHNPNIDKDAQAILDMWGKIYIDGEPMILYDGTEISFDSLTPIGKYAINHYLYRMGILLKAKAAAHGYLIGDRIIKIDETKYDLNILINKANNLIQSLEDQSWEWIQNLPLCPDEIAQAIHADAAVKKYLKAEHIRIKKLQKQK